MVSTVHTCALTETCPEATCDDVGLSSEEAWNREGSMEVDQAVPLEMSKDDEMTLEEGYGEELEPCESWVAFVPGDCECDRCGDQEVDGHRWDLHIHDDRRAMDFVQSPCYAQDSEA